MMMPYRRVVNALLVSAGLWSLVGLGGCGGGAAGGGGGGGSGSDTVNNAAANTAASAVSSNVQGALTSAMGSMGGQSGLRVKSMKTKNEISEGDCTFDYDETQGDDGSYTYTSTYTCNCSGGGTSTFTETGSGTLEECGTAEDEEFGSMPQYIFTSEGTFSMMFDGCTETSTCSDDSSHAIVMNGSGSGTSTSSFNDCTGAQSFSATMETEGGVESCDGISITVDPDTEDEATVEMGAEMSFSFTDDGFDEESSESDEFDDEFEEESSLHVKSVTESDDADDDSDSDEDSDAEDEEDSEDDGFSETIAMCVNGTTYDSMEEMEAALDPTGICVGSSSSSDSDSSSSDDDFDSSDDTDDSDSSDAVFGLKEAVCAKIIECNPDVTEDDCFDGFLGTNQLTNDFGVPVDENSMTMSEVAEGDFDINGGALSQCLTDIEALTCDDLEFGFDPENPSNYDNIENFIPEEEGSCEEVFAGEDSSSDSV